MKTSKITINSLNDNGLRLDASLYLSEGIQILKFLNSPLIKTKPLKEVTSNIFYGSRSRRVYVTNVKNGIPFIKGADITKSDFSSLKLLSRKKTYDLQSYMLKEGWTLITRSGSIGNTAFVNKDFIGKAASDDIIRVCPQDIPEGFLYAYLSSKYGNILLTQNKYGAVIQHIEPEHIADIPVPIFPESQQKEIHNLIVESANLRVEANRLLEEAQEKFLNSNRLNFSKELLNPQERVFGNIFSENHISPLSFKARNYSVRAKEIISILSEANNNVSLDEFLEKPFYMGSRASFKRISSPNFKGVDIVSQGDVHQRNPLTFKQVKAKKINNSTAERKMIIMPSAGTLGENEVFTRPLLIRNNFEGKLLSEVIGVFECKTEEDAAYLYNFLSSKALFRVLRTVVYGTNLLYPNWELMKNIKIPICSNSDLQEIIKKTLKAFDYKGNANIKETQAIQLIEKEIESWQRS